MDYIVRLSDLFQRIKEMQTDGMDYVQIELVEADITMPNNPIPPCVHFDGFQKQNSSCCVDYEDIPVVELSD